MTCRVSLRCEEADPAVMNFTQWGCGHRSWSCDRVEWLDRWCDLITERKEEFEVGSKIKYIIKSYILTKWYKYLSFVLKFYYFAVMSITQLSCIDNSGIVANDIAHIVSDRVLWDVLSSEGQFQQRFDQKEKIKHYLGHSVEDDKCQIISQWRDYDVIIYEWKVYRFPKAGKEFDLYQEKKILDTIRPHVSLPIPQVEIIDNAFIVYPCIEWQTLTKCDVVYSDEFVDTLVWFIKELHDIPLDKFDFLYWDDETGDQKSQFQSWVQSLQDEMAARLEWKVPSGTITKLQDYIHEVFLTYKSSIKVFTHGDLHGKNIIYNQQEQKIAWIIDFTGSGIWWAEVDFCRFAYRDDDLLERMVIAYLWKMDQWFIDRVKFLARKTMIRQIKNDDMYHNNFQAIIDRLQKYEFI